MQPNRKEQAFCLEEGKAEDYTQNQNADKSKAGKAADKNAIHNPCWKVNH